MTEPKSADRLSGRRRLALPSGRMGGAPCVDLSLRPERGAADLDGLGKSEARFASRGRVLGKPTPVALAAVQLGLEPPRETP